MEERGHIVVAAYATLWRQRERRLPARLKLEPRDVAHDHHELDRAADAQADHNPLTITASGGVTSTGSGQDAIDGGPGTLWSIVNGGKIASTNDGLSLRGGAKVTNQAGASISGQGANGAGIFVMGGHATVTNGGSISGPNHHGILINAGGTVTNSKAGSNQRQHTGVFMQSVHRLDQQRRHISSNGSDGTAAYLESGGSITNLTGGTITGAKFGAFIEAGGTVTNSGTITGSTYDGVVLGHGGTVINNAGALVTAGSVGIYVKYRSPGTITNAGTVRGTGANGTGIDLADGGSLSNAVGATIAGSVFGVFTNGGTATVGNSGSISGAKYDGVALEAGGTVTNQANATITGASNGVYTRAGGGLTNSGSVTGQVAGADLGQGGTLTNNAGGTISGNSFGVFTSGAAGTVNNSGTLSGGHGVALEAGGSLTNNAGASVTGTTSGLFTQGSAATVVNAGTITGTAAGSTGADVEGGGSITNNSGGSIIGTSYGVFLTGGNGTVSNNGTIGGASYAVKFADGVTNRLVVSAGAVFNGAVGGGSGSQSTLELAGGTGSIAGLSGGSGTATENGASWFFLHFNNLAVDAGANWTLTGTDQAATITNNGTVNVTGSLDVTSAIDPTSSGVFLLNGGASLEVAAALGTATRFSFATGSKLTVDAAGSFGTGVGTSGYAGPNLQNFASGDTIDLLNFGNAGSSFTYNAGSGLLQLNNGAAQSASLDFQTSSLSGSSFQLASDGGNGTLVTRV